jgi:ribonuclease D
MRADMAAKEERDVMSEIEILTTNSEIKELAAELATDSVIGVDLEADALHNYQEKVCLMQFTGSKRTVLVDPLAADLAPLGPILADPAIRKIFHAGDYDLRCLRRDFGFEVKSLFDTMICSQFCGEEKIGLADLLGKYFDVSLDKKYQKADWSLRPLPPEMAHYAAEDTRHLHRLAELLEEKLHELGRFDWVAEECLLMEQVGFAENGGPKCLRFKGAGTLDRRQLALLEELLRWRDEEAQRRNCPMFKVMGNKPMLELARRSPETVQGMAGVEGLYPRQIERHGKGLLQALDRGRAVPDDQLPIFPRQPRREKDPEAERRVKKLKQWRTDKASELQLDPGVLINNAMLEAIARLNPDSVQDLNRLEAMKNWQRQVLGEGLVKSLKG